MVHVHGTPPARGVVWWKEVLTLGDRGRVFQAVG